METETIEATPVVESENSGLSETISLEKARELRSEAKGLRERAKQAESKLAELSATHGTVSAQLESARSQAEQRVLQLESDYRGLQLQLAVAEIARAPEIGAKRPEALTRLVDSTKIEFDKDGKVRHESVLKALGAVKLELPELFYNGAGSINGADAPSATGADMNALIRSRAR